MTNTLPHTVSYSGDKPYVFISYAHKDAGVVVPLVQAMQNDGYRIWFDMGIEVGTEWSNDIASHLRDCALFVAFISKNSVSSENCLDEIAYAKSHQKPALMIFLEEDVVLPEGTEMQTARFQRMYYNRIGTIEGFMASINNSSFFAPCREVVVAPQPVAAYAPAAPVAPTPVYAQPAPVAPAVQPIPVAPVQAPPKKRKKGLLIALIAIVAVLAIVGGLIASGVIKFGGDEDDKKTASELLAGSVVVNGKTYQLPMDFSVLLADGWTFSNESSIQLPGKTGTEYKGTDMVSVALTNGNQILAAICYNPSSQACSLQDSKVCALIGSAKYEDFANTVSFSHASGISFASTKADVEQTFGKATVTKALTDFGFDATGTVYVYGDDLSSIDTITASSSMVAIGFDEQGKVTMIFVVKITM